MSKTVFIIGAGVSKQAGAPLMNDFLDVADRLRKTTEIADPDFDLVFRGRDALQAVHSKSTMDLLNLESVFAAFEMAKLLRRLGTLSVEEVEALPEAMTRVIQRTLEMTIMFPISNGRAKPPHPYAEIVELVTQRNKQAPRSTFSFITFNYDICLDLALYVSGHRIDYCLGPPVENAVKLLKLHGSLNWSQCPKCSQIVAYRMEEFFQRTTMVAFEAGPAKVIISSGLGRIPHCDVTLSSHPFIAPPTWNKTQYHTQLESVWRAAAKELSDAESIVICGYSLPETDQFFRYLYALGTVGGSGLRRFWVINPDEDLEPRFRALCGPLALCRFKFIPKIVEQTIPNLAASLD
jgi:NAD-dependent SIR2 family protein deacetylase